MKGFLNVLSKKDKKSSIKLEETNSNNNNKKSYDYCVNALVLGLVQSGKTTLQRQLEILYGLETIDKKFCQKTIYGNTLSTLIMLIEGTEALNINLDPYNVERVDRVKSCPIELAKDRLPRFPLKLSYDCKCLWEDSSIQMVYNHSKFCSQFRIPGRSKYYMDNMFRVFSPEFIPNELDILSLYAPGEKSSISSVLHRRLKMEMISCPGTESTPKDWINLYNLYRPHYLFYVVSLKDYIIDNINLCTSELVGELPASSRETCSHHQHKNQLLESLKTFETLVNSELFEKSYSVILIFNINEIFYESVKLFDFKHTFPDYDGADDPDKAITYITNKFTKYLIEKNKPYQALNINLLQKSNIKDAYEEILDFLIPDAEKRNLIYDITSPTAIDAQHQQHQQQQQSNGSGPNTPQMNSVTSTLSHSGSSISSSRDSTTSNSSSKHRKRNNSDSSNHPSSVLPSAVSTIGTGPPSNHMNMIQSLNIDTHIELKETTTTTTTTSTTTSNNSSSNSNSSSNNVKSPSKVKDKKAINLPKQQKKKKGKGLASVSSGFHSMQGRRKNMEDTHAIYDDLLETLNYQGREEIGQCSYYAVYDGHGGTETSKALEPIVHKCIVESPSFKSGQYEQSLREGFEQADKMVIPICGKSGSTGVSCMLVGNQLYCANIGDSEAVLARNTISSSGKPPVYESHLLTYKHLANDDKEKQRITELGGMIIFGRLFGSLAVSRSFGDREYKEGEKKFVTCEPFQQTIELTPKDHFLILACDGLWDQVSYDEAVQMVAKLLKLGKSPQEISQALAQDSWEKGSVDNITVLVIVLNWK